MELLKIGDKIIEYRIVRSNRRETVENLVETIIVNYQERREWLKANGRKLIIK